MKNRGLGLLLIIPVAMLVVTPFATQGIFLGNEYYLVVSCDSDGSTYSASTITFLGHAYYALCPPNTEGWRPTTIISSASGTAVIVLYAGGNTYSKVVPITPRSGCMHKSIFGPGYAAAYFELDASGCG
jgi:hypothetical protein